MRRTMYTKLILSVLMLSQGLTALAQGTERSSRNCSSLSKSKVACLLQKQTPTKTTLQNINYHEAANVTDPKTNEEVLELIVKIAENPNTWKQIHRVIETLEANNAAYSQRIFSKLQRNYEQRKADLIKLEEASNYRNNYPEDPVNSKAGTESLFDKWKESLLADASSHPQIIAAQEHVDEEWKNRNVQFSPGGDISVDADTLPQKDEAKPLGKSFEDRLRDIESELSRLAKKSRPQRKPVSATKLKLKIKPSSDAPNVKKPQSVLSSRSSTRISFHKVNKDDQRSGRDFWRRLAVDSSQRRNAVVAVSIRPNKPIPLNRNHPKGGEISDKLRDEVANDKLKSGKVKGMQTEKYRQPSRRATASDPPRGEGK